MIDTAPLRRNLLDLAITGKLVPVFVGGRCVGGIQRRLKRLLSADFTVEKD